MHIKGRALHLFVGIFIFSSSLYSSDSSLDDSVEIKPISQSSAKKFPLVSPGAAQQFLQPGQQQPREDHFYHDGKGDAGYRAHVGNTNVSVGTDVGSLVRFAKDIGSFLFGGQEEKEHPATVAHNAKQNTMHAQLKEDRKDFENRYATQKEEQLITRQTQIEHERKQVIDRGIEQGYVVQDKKNTRKVRREAQREHERLGYENRKLATESNVIKERLKTIEQNKPVIAKVTTNNITSVPIAKTAGVSEINKVSAPIAVIEIKEHKPQVALASATPVQPSEMKPVDVVKPASKPPADPKLAHVMPLANKSKKSSGVSKRPSVPIRPTLPKKPTGVTSNVERWGKALGDMQGEIGAALYIFDFITSDPEKPTLDRHYRSTIDTYPHDFDIGLEDIIKENYHQYLKEFSTGQLVRLHRYADDVIDPKNESIFGYSKERIEQNKKVGIFGELVREELKKRSGYSSDNTAQNKFSWHKDIVEQMARDSNNFIEESRGYRYFAKKLETGEEVWLVEKDGRIKGSNIVIPREIKITKFSPEEQVVYMDDEEVLNTNYTSLLANMSDKGLTLLQDKSKKYLEKTDREWNSNPIDRNWRYYVGMPVSYTLREELSKRINDEISSRNAASLSEQEEFGFSDDVGMEQAEVEGASGTMPPIIHSVENDVSQVKSGEIQSPVVIAHAEIECATENQNTIPQAVQTDEIKCENLSYDLTPEIQQLFDEIEGNAHLFENCYGTQYQQQLHKRMIFMLGKTSVMPIYSVLHPHRKSMTQCIEAACIYNKSGHVDCATTVTSFCWDVLSWGGAIARTGVECIVEGVTGAVVDIVTHPLETLVSVAVGGKIALAYQASKVLYKVADVGITALINYDAAQKKFVTYTQPLSKLFAAIKNREIGIKEAAKGATRFAVQVYAQSKLLGSLRGFCGDIRKQTAAFLSKKPAISQEYTSAPEGQLLAAAQDALVKQETNLSLRQSLTSDGRLQLVRSIPFDSSMKDVLAWTSRSVSKVAGRIAPYMTTDKKDLGINLLAVLDHGYKQDSSDKNQDSNNASSGDNGAPNPGGKDPKKEKSEEGGEKSDSGNMVRREQNPLEKTINDIKANAQPGTETNGKSKQYIKKGDFDDAKKDFESLKPFNIRPIPNGLAGNLVDGRTINIRIKSSEGSPTLEIFNPINRRMIKFRYKNSI